MTSQEFGDMQPGQLYEQLDGHKWRMEQEENRLAHFTAAAMSVHTKKPVNPKDLVKPLRK